MKTQGEDISVSDEPSRQRYELKVAGEIAGFVNYRQHGGSIELVHTEVLPQFAGQGLAQRLTQFVLDDVRRQGRTVVPTCSYAAQYIERHPQLQDLLAGEGSRR